MDHNRPPLPRFPGAEGAIGITQRQIDERGSLRSRIVQSIDTSTACFENVCRPIVDAENSQSGMRALISVAKYFAPEAEMREAADKANEMWSTNYSEEPDNNKMEELFKAVKAREEELDLEDQKFLDQELLNGQEGGSHSLAGDDLERWLENDKKIDQLAAEFQRKHSEIESGEWFTLDELDGVQGHAYDAGEKRADGKEFIKASGNSYRTVMKYAHNSKTRERLQRIYLADLGGNVARFREIILLRDENARLLGFHSHAAMKIDYRIAESTQWIDQLMEEMVQVVRPFSRAEMESIKEKKRSLVQDNGESMEVKSWDVDYYLQLIENEAGVDHAAIAEYFPLQHTFVKMLALFGDCPGLEFDRVPAEELKNATWHPKVEVWAVRDSRPEHRGKFIGYLYTDLESRSNKRKGACALALQEEILVSPPMLIRQYLF